MSAKTNGKWIADPNNNPFCGNGCWEKEISAVKEAFKTQIDNGEGHTALYVRNSRQIDPAIDTEFIGAMCSGKGCKNILRA